MVGFRHDPMTMSGLSRTTRGVRCLNGQLDENKDAPRARRKPEERRRGVSNGDGADPRDEQPIFSKLRHKKGVKMRIW